MLGFYNLAHCRSSRIFTGVTLEAAAAKLPLPGVSNLTHSWLRCLIRHGSPFKYNSVQKKRNLSDQVPRFTGAQ